MLFFGRSSPEGIFSGCSLVYPRDQRSRYPVEMAWKKLLQDISVTIMKSE